MITERVVEELVMSATDVSVSRVAALVTRANVLADEPTDPLGQRDSELGLSLAALELAAVSLAGGDQTPSPFDASFTGYDTASACIVAALEEVEYWDLAALPDAASAFVVDLFELSLEC